MRYTTVVVLRSGRIVDLGAGESIPLAVKMKPTDPEPDVAADAFTTPCDRVEELRARYKNKRQR